MPLDPTLDELSDQQSMTHQAPQPNLVQPYLDAARNFSSGGILGMLEGAGYSPPEWAKAPQAVLNNPSANLALGIMGGTRGFTGMAARTGNTQSLYDLERAKQLEAHGPLGRTPAWGDTKWYREYGTDIWNKEIYDNPSTLNGLNIPSVRQYLPSETTVGSVLNHPGLYNAYPHTKDLPVIFEENHNPGWHAAYLPPHADPARPQGAIYIFNPHATSTAEIKSSLLHELQHSVDQYEGRPVRASHGMPTDDYLRLIEEMRARNTQWRAKFTPQQLQQLNMSPWATMRQMQFPFRENEAILPP